MATLPRPSTGGRAWGAQPTATAEAPGGPAAGQQWWPVRDTSPVSGQPLGTFRLVNRYSNLVLGLPATAGASSQTTPERTWSGAGQSPAQQVMTIKPAPAG